MLTNEFLRRKGTLEKLGIRAMCAKFRTKLRRLPSTVFRSGRHRPRKPVPGETNQSPRLRVLVLVAFWAASAFSPANCAEIWLSGRPDMPDYLQMFAPDASWARAAERIAVFKVSTRFLGGASDEVLRRVFSDLRRRHISLAWEGLMLTATPASCGNGIEGYADTNTIKTIVERIRRFGGNLRYVAMDEPLWFGHASTLRNACHTPVNDLARAVAGKVAIITHSFPNARFGDIEVVGTRIPPDWIGELVQWADFYRAAVGEPLAFFQTDVLWDGPWRDQLKELVPRLRVRGIKFDIIYNGNLDDETSLAWTRHAEEKFAAVEGDPSLVPDQAVLQTWMAYPTHMLPETEPGTMTWLVDRYLATETRIALHRIGSRLEGQLTDAAGRPLAGALVTLLAQITAEPGAPALHTRSGRVPPKAAAAVLALRINAECNCSGPADIGIGPMRYHDDRTGQTVQQGFQSPVAPGDAATLARFQAQQGQPITQNAPRFPVTADDPFTIEVPMRSDLAAVRSGYVALIFLDAQGKEVKRLRLTFAPARRAVATLATDAHGNFSFLSNPEVLRYASGFRVEFAGTPRYRMAAAGMR